MKKDVLAWMASTIRKLDQRVKDLESTCHTIHLAKLVPDRPCFNPDAAVFTPGFDTPIETDTCTPDVQHETEIQKTYLRSQQLPAPAASMLAKSCFNPDAADFTPSFDTLVETEIAAPDVQHETETQQTHLKSQQLPAPATSIPSAVLLRESLQSPLVSQQDQVRDRLPTSTCSTPASQEPSVSSDTPTGQLTSVRTETPPLHAMEQLFDALSEGDRRACYRPIELILGTWHMDYLDDEEHMEVYHLRDRIEIVFCRDTPDFDVFAEWLWRFLTDDLIETKAARE